MQRADGEKDAKHETKIKTEPGIKTEPEIKAEMPEIKAEIVAETKPEPKSEAGTESEPDGPMAQLVAEPVSERTPVTQARGRVHRRDPSPSHGPTKRQRQEWHDFDTGKDLILKRLEEGKAKWHRAVDIQHGDVLRSLLFSLAGS